MQQLTDLYAYKNTAMFDKVRTLKWSNGAILEAIRYYKEISGEEVTHDFIQTELKSMKLRAVQALLFGALKAEQPNFTIKLFGDKYKPENLQLYVVAVLDGMVHYFPEPETHDPGANLDPEWPDTQKEVKKKLKSKKPIGDSGTGSAKK